MSAQLFNYSFNTIIVLDCYFDYILFFVKWCLRQPQGTHLCAYYVFEYIRYFVNERDRKTRTENVRIHYSHIVLSSIHNLFYDDFK